MKGFEEVQLEGLGRCLKCRDCGAIFISKRDALRHRLLYHKKRATPRVH